MFCVHGFGANSQYRVKSCTAYTYKNIPLTTTYLRDKSDHKITKIDLYSYHHFRTLPNSGHLIRGLVMKPENPKAIEKMCPQKNHLALVIASDPKHDNLHSFGLFNPILNKAYVFFQPISNHAHVQLYLDCIPNHAKEYFALTPDFNLSSLFS